MESSRRIAPFLQAERVRNNRSDERDFPTDGPHLMHRTHADSVLTGVDLRPERREKEREIVGNMIHGDVRLPCTTD